MTSEQLIEMFPSEGMPIFPIAAVEALTDDVVQVYVGLWKEGKITMEIALATIICLLARHNNHLQEFIHNAKVQVEEPKLVEQPTTTNDQITT